jgi:hypothetical protein
VIAASVLQTAIYTALTTAPPISAPVYDEVPQGTVLSKYVVIGDTALERPWDTHDSEGSEQYPQLDIWSNAKGAREAQLIMEEIDARLHNVLLALSAGQTVLLQRDLARVFKDQPVAGETWRHGILRYRVLVTE